MPKRSSKSKSKRLTLRAKNKVIRKVREHHKKKRKELKKSGRTEPKAPKDPGLPQQWPFKEDLVKEFAFHKARILHQEAEKKAQRKAQRLAAKEAMEEGDGDEFSRLQAEAAAKEGDFETRKRARLVDSGAGGDEDNSRKAFYKEFRKVVQLADVIIQVLDARDPLSCRCVDVERYIRQTNPNKKIILLLNKMDLVPREVGESWLKYFREELPCIAFKCSTQSQASRIGQKKIPVKPGSKRMTWAGGDDGMQTSACLGADTLIQMLKNYTRNANVKSAITVGVVGLPNVGKSSLINSLKRSRVAQVGNTPGVTKAVQEVHLDKTIKLLDSPGIVFASADDAGAVLRNCIKVERLDDLVTPVGEILKRVPAKQLMQIYRIASFADATPSPADKFLQLVAEVRGCLKKGGVPDTRAAARLVLNDWNNGRIPYFTSPPARGNEEFQGAAVVGSWSSEFNADEVFATERSAVIAHLPSMNDGSSAAGGKGDTAGQSFFELKPAGVVKVDMAAMEEDDGPCTSDEENGAGDMEDDEDEYGLDKSKKKAKKGVPASISELLYGEEGQVNPHAARAERKKQKKVAAAARLAVNEKDYADGQDFEFEDQPEDEEEEEGDEDESEDEDEDEDEEGDEMSD